MSAAGYLKPVMDGYTMAAGKGVHFWCFAQSISALDSTWGKEHRKTLLDLAEVVQILGFPRTEAVAVCVAMVSIMTISLSVHPPGPGAPS